MKYKIENKKLVKSSEGTFTLEDLQKLNIQISKFLKKDSIPTRFENIVENHHVKRGMEIALAGNHSVTLIYWSNSKEIAEQFLNIGIDNDLPIYMITLCPCGNYNSKTHACSCESKEVREFQQNNLVNSDINLEVIAPTKPKSKSEDHDQIIKRVDVAKEHLHLVDNFLCEIGERIMKSTVAHMMLDSQEYEEVVNVAKSVSAISNSKEIKPAYLAEALQYRMRKYE